MGAPSTRTITDEIADAVDRLGTVIREAEQMRSHLRSAAGGDLDGTLGYLNAAQRSGRIVAASLGEARAFAAEAQLAATRQASDEA
jgi:hypothetical protein